MEQTDLRGQGTREGVQGNAQQTPPRGAGETGPWCRASRHLFPALCPRAQPEQSGKERK